MAFSTSYCKELRDSKAELSAQIKALTAGYLARGGMITYCPLAVAHGAEFSRNQHPKLGIQVPAEA